VLDQSRSVTFERKAEADLRSLVAVWPDGRAVLTGQPVRAHSIPNEIRTMNISHAPSRCVLPDDYRHLEQLIQGMEAFRPRGQEWDFVATTGW